jgi:hypothetical protein
MSLLKPETILGGDKELQFEGYIARGAGGAVFRVLLSPAIQTQANSRCLIRKLDKYR